MDRAQHEASPSVSCLQGHSQLESDMFDLDCDLMMTSITPTLSTYSASLPHRPCTPVSLPGSLTTTGSCAALNTPPKPVSIGFSSSGARLRSSVFASFPTAPQISSLLATNPSVHSPSASVPPLSASVPPLSASVPSLSASVPPLLASVSSMSASVPSMFTSVPPLSATVPPLSASVPPLLASVPSLPASVPSMSASVPSLSASVPPLTASVPSMLASVPPLSASVPPLSASVPPLLASVPSMSASVPSMSASVPPLLASVPSLPASVPPLSASVPPLSASVPPILTSVPATLASNQPVPASVPPRSASGPLLSASIPASESLPAFSPRPPRASLPITEATSSSPASDPMSAVLPCLSYPSLDDGSRVSPFVVSLPSQTLPWSSSGLPSMPAPSTRSMSPSVQNLSSSHSPLIISMPAKTVPPSHQTEPSGNALPTSKDRPCLTQRQQDSAKPTHEDVRPPADSPADSPSQHFAFQGLDCLESLPDVVETLSHAQRQQFAEIERQQGIAQLEKAKLQKKKEELAAIRMDLSACRRRICLAEEEGASLSVDCKALQTEIDSVCMGRLLNDKRISDVEQRLEEETRRFEDYLAKMVGHRDLVHRAEYTICPDMQELEKQQARILDLQTEKAAMEGELVGLGKATGQTPLHQLEQEVNSLERQRHQVSSAIAKSKTDITNEGLKHDSIKQATRVLHKRNQAQLTRLKRQLKEGQLQNQQWADEAKQLETQLEQTGDFTEE